MNTKQIGNLTELQCITYLYGLGYDISIPFGNANKYDLIMDVDGKLYRVQCKHSSEYCDETGEVEYIKFKATWQSHNTKGYLRKKYTTEDVDFFATFYQNKCYLIPVRECSFEKILRLKNPKNGQTKGVSFLSDYLAEGVISKL